MKNTESNSTARISYLRSRARISQGTLSKESGVNVMTISKLERGVAKMENLTLKNAIALADALGVQDLRELL